MTTLPPASTIGDAACYVLNTAAADDKARTSLAMGAAWQKGDLSPDCATVPPGRPGRPPKPELKAPGEMPKRRKAGTVNNRVALLHAVTHIELNAIDLAWDLIARFGAGMPRAFIDDWVQVGMDEARHFRLLNERLRQLGATYGDLPAHDGLWQAAHETAHDFAARLAVVPLVLEARGLDVTPAMMARLTRAGDDESAAALRIIYNDEIAHVAAGVRWFQWLAERDGFDARARYQALVRRYFKGAIKPPFNHDARQQAAFQRDFYEPLSVAKSEA